MSSGVAQILRSVPLFPLPNVVLLPRAVLPLHIFEQRYREMMHDALRGDRQIAMALLRPGWEKLYHAKAEIEPVVCVGKILTHEELPDGRFNLLLQGHLRAKIARELQTDTLYRQADLTEIKCTPVLEIDLSDARGKLIELFSSSPLVETAAGEQFMRLLQSSLSTAEVVDLAAFTFIEDVQVKQSLLEETDTRQRVRRVVQALDALRPLIITQSQREQASNN